MRVRRETAGGTGDDDEADVAYDSNDELSLDSAISNASTGVTATTLGEFINVGTVGGTTYSNPDSLTVTASCFVDEWKDQSGNANHATQVTFGDQPQIHSGTVNTDLITENGNAALSFDTSQIFTQVSISTGNLNDFGVFAVGKNTGTANSFKSIGSVRSTGSPSTLAYRTSQITYGGSIYGTASNNTAYNLVSVYADNASSDVKGYFNQSQIFATTPVSDAINGLNIANSGGVASTYWEGTIQEILLYPSSTKSDHTGIESDINSEYLIYQPTDAPTSGLLYDYGSATGGTDAAAAYSVRQLSDKAVIALRIRRDSDDEERNIGFDSNGDLDTTAISDFCQTANGYVTRWWDQSTNGIHADQPAGGTGSNSLQPQIYNGTSVITENSKPALDFDGTNALNISVTGTVTNFTAFFVRGFATYPNTFQNGFHYKARGIGYNQAGGTGYRIAHLINGTSSVQRADSYPTTTGQALDYFLNQSELYRNSASQTLQSGSTYGANTTSVIGGWQESSQNITATIQELIIYESDESSNRTGITSDITTYFSIS